MLDWILRESKRERAKGSMKNRGQEDIKWDMKDEEGWWGGGEKSDGAEQSPVPFSVDYH